MASHNLRMAKEPLKRRVAKRFVRLIQVERTVTSFKDATRDGVEITRDAHAGLQGNLTPKARKAELARLEDDFKLVLRRWNIAEQDIEQQALQSLIVSVLFGVCSIASLILAVYGIHNSFVYAVSGLATSLVSAYFSLFNIWRRDILINRRFVTPSDWLRGSSKGSD